MLKLKIENFDKLPNGGPLEYSVDRRGFDFGRELHLDWSLPDKSRVVSGKHCEVRFHDNAYWLYDTSTNGTFLNDSSKRMQSPYLLANGDKLAVGDYVISVQVALPLPVAVAPQSRAPVPEHSTPAPAAGENIWDSPQAAPPPIDPRVLMPPAPERERAPDFLSQAAYIPPVFEPSAIVKPSAARAEMPAPAEIPGNAPTIALSSQPASAPKVAETREGFDAPPISSGISDSNFLERFAKGARLPASALSATNSGDLAELSGQMMLVTCLHLMSLLHARAEAKTLSRSGNRTMVQSTSNNPLKFTPTPEDALRIMLGPKTEGYLGATQTLENSFADLKAHQIASLAAMQTAVTNLFETLSPEAITKSAEGKKSSLLVGAKGKQWDNYVEAWAKKADKHEHGMLGAFLEVFAEHYDRLSKQKN